MGRSMAREVGDDNICVNTAVPSLTISENVLNRIDRGTGSNAM